MCWKPFESTLFQLISVRKWIYCSHEIFDISFFVVVVVVINPITRVIFPEDGLFGKSHVKRTSSLRNSMPSLLYTTTKSSLSRNGIPNVIIPLDGNESVYRCTNHYNKSYLSGFFPHSINREETVQWRDQFLFLELGIYLVFFYIMFEKLDSLSIWPNG